MNPSTMAGQPGCYLCHGRAVALPTFFRAANFGAKNASKQAYLCSGRNLGRETGETIPSHAIGHGSGMA